MLPSLPAPVLEKARGDPASCFYLPGKLGLSFQSGKLRSNALNAGIPAPLAHVTLLELLGCPGPNPWRAATIPAIPTFAQSSRVLCQHWSEARTHFRALRPLLGPLSPVPATTVHWVRSCSPHRVSNSPFSPGPRPSGCCLCSRDAHRGVPGPAPNSPPVKILSRPWEFAPSLSVRTSAPSAPLLA